MKSKSLSQPIIPFVSKNQKGPALNPGLLFVARTIMSAVSTLVSRLFLLTAYLTVSATVAECDVLPAVPVTVIV
jgi:hypothetical protein